MLTGIDVEVTAEQHHGIDARVSCVMEVYLLIDEIPDVFYLVLTSVERGLDIVHVG